MILLFIYVFVALVFSFLCSVAEAVILSVSIPYIVTLEKQGKKAGQMLRTLKEEINRSLAAILTLNTIAHTIGAAGAGAQAAEVFGSAYVGIASAILTLLILIFSEIIPKSLGAHYWRRLAPATAYSLNVLIKALYPFVLMSEKITASLGVEQKHSSHGRRELAAMAEDGAREGHLEQQEHRIIKNLLHLRETPIRNAMTPRTVVFSLTEELTVADFFDQHDHVRFTRIPVYETNSEHISGFVLRDDLILAQARGNSSNSLSTYRREIPILQDSADLARAFQEFLDKRAHIMLVVDEYGGMAGIITLEDVLETLLGLEIVDEEDRNSDMQKLARTLWRKRAREMGLQIDKLTNQDSSRG